MQKTLSFVAGFFVIIVLGNLLILDLFFVSLKSEQSDLITRTGQLSDNFKTLTSRIYGMDFSQKEGSTVISNNTSDDQTCGIDCIMTIRAATASAIRYMQTLPKSTTTIYRPSTTTTSLTSGARGEFFVPLGSGTIGGGLDWTNVDTAQATFDASNFGKIKTSYFEVFIKTTSGEVSARLFDSTTPFVFFSSEVKNSSDVSQFISAPIVLAAGIKTYKVQMKTTIGSGILDQARIRIIAE